MTATTEIVNGFTDIPADRLLSVADLARGLAVTERTIRRWIKCQGFPPPMKFSSKFLRWRMCDVRAWIENNARKAQENAWTKAAEAKAVEERNRAQGYL